MAVTLRRSEAGKTVHEAADYSKCQRTLRPRPGPHSGGNAAAVLFERIATHDEYVEFLTLPAYEWLTRTLREPVAA